METINELCQRLDAIEKLLLQQKAVFKPEEAANYLDISLSTLYKMTSAGILPFSKPNGKLIYFSKSSLDDWMLSKLSRSLDQTNKEAATYITTQYGS